MISSRPLPQPNKINKQQFYGKRQTRFILRRTFWRGFFPWVPSSSWPKLDLKFKSLYRFHWELIEKFWGALLMGVWLKRSSFPTRVAGTGEGACFRMSRFQAQAEKLKHSALPFVLKGTSFRARHIQTRPAFQMQISLIKSHSEPSPYCKRIRDDTSHRYLDLTRKREKERGSSDVECCDISAQILKGCLKGQLFCRLDCHEV